MFYLLFEEQLDLGLEIDTMIALLSEYGTPSTMTTHRIEEYGKTIMKENAMKQLITYFG